MDNCPLHNVEMFNGKFGPVHKTDDENFPKGWCNGKVKTNYKQVWSERKTDFIKPKEEKPDWDAISRGKVRHGVAIAFIAQGRTLDEATIAEMQQWVDWIMDQEKLPF